MNRDTKIVIGTLGVVGVIGLIVWYEKRERAQAYAKTLNSINYVPVPSTTPLSANQTVGAVTSLSADFIEHLLS